MGALLAAVVGTLGVTAVQAQAPRDDQARREVVSVAHRQAPWSVPKEAMARTELVTSPLRAVLQGTDDAEVRLKHGKGVSRFDEPSHRADEKSGVAGVGAAAQLLLSDGFEGAFPGPWSVFDNNGGANGQVFWDDTNFRSDVGNWSVWCADGGADASARGSDYSNNMDSWLVFGPFNLSDAASGRLSFRYWNRSEDNFDYFQYFVSVDGTLYHGFQTSGDSGGWRSGAIDFASVPTLGDVTGDSSVWVAFVFKSDNSVTDEGAYVDEVRVEKTVLGGGADLVIRNLALSSPSASAGESLAVTYDIRNLGTTPVAAGYRESLYLSSNASLGASDILLNTSHNHSQVGAGGTHPGSLSVTIPSGASPGAYFLLVEADTDATVSETNESNNLSAVPLSIDSPATRVLLSDGFEGSFPGGIWSVFDNDGTDNGQVFWDDTNFRSDVGNWSVWCADGGTEASARGATYSDNMDSWMVFGPFDLRDAIGGSLSFRYWNRSEANFDYFKYLVSINGSLYHGFQVSGDSGGWQNGAIDFRNVPTLGDVTGASSVWIAFVFTSDGNSTAEGAYVDEVRVEKTVRSSGTDFVIQDLALSSSNVNPGQALTVTYNVRNQGAAPADAGYRESVYLSSDSSLGLTDTLLATSHHHAQVGAGGTHSGNLSVTIPSDAGGNYFLLVEADTDEVVSETDESNNVAAAPLSVAFGLRDLVIQDLALSTAIANAGQSLTVTYNVKNRGTSPVEFGYRESVYLSTNSSLGSGDILLTSSHEHAHVGAGGTHFSSLNATIPSGTPPGSYFVLVEADTDDAVFEVNESNNVSGVPLSIDSLGNRDLLIQDLAVSPSSALPGQNLVVTYNVRNQGSSPVAAGYRERVYLSGDSTLQASDILLGASHNHSQVGAGSTHPGNLSLAIPGGMPIGSYFLLVEADTDGVVAETNESNNVSSVGLQVVANQNACVILVHGSMESDENVSDIAADWRAGRDYWRMSYIKGILSDSEDFVRTVTTVSSTESYEHFVVRWDGSARYDSPPASGRVASEILRAFRGEFDGPANDALRSKCDPTDRFYVIAHSMGAQVMDFILGNSSPSDPFYNHNGLYDQVARGLTAVITIGGAHRGSRAADFICKEEDPPGPEDWTKCDTGWIFGFGMNCTEARTWLQTEDFRQVHSNASAPSIPTLLIGGDRGLIFPANTSCLPGQDDSVLTFTSQFACSDIPSSSSSYEIETVCDNSDKVTSNFFNVDTGNENHDDERNNNDTLNLRERHQIPDGIWLRNGTLFDPGETVFADVSAAEVANVLISAIEFNLSSGTKRGSGSLPDGVSVALDAASVAGVSGRYPPFSGPIEPMPTVGDRGRLSKSEPIRDPLEKKRVSHWSTSFPDSEDRRVLKVRPSRISFTSPEPIVLYAMVEKDAQAIPARIQATLRSEDPSVFADVADFRDDGVLPDQAAHDGVQTASITPPPGLEGIFSVRADASTLRGGPVSARLDVYYGIPTAELTGGYRDEAVSGNLVIQAQVEAQRAGRYHLQGSLYGADGTPIAWAQTTQVLEAGTHWMPLTFFGLTISERAISGTYSLRDVLLSNTTEIPTVWGIPVEEAYTTKGYDSEQFTSLDYVEWRKRHDE